VSAKSPGSILLTGATGYVGGRLLRRLEEANRRVRCLTRRPEALAGRVAERTEVVRGDLLDRDSVVRAMRDVDSAYYLVHSMSARGDFEQLDRRAAANFAEAARAAGIGRIIYLSGLGSGSDLSPHLASRHEVGDILRSSGIATIELRASIVIGSGSASFETVRGLVEDLPAIPAPRWVETAAQPIAIDDVLAYLLAALTLEHPTNTTIEIGGSDRVTYAELMREYARQRKLKRRVLSMPVVSARAARAFLPVMIPGYGRIAASMVESLRNETVVQDRAAREVFSIEPRGLAEAINHALAAEDREFAELRWSDAIASDVAIRWGGVPFGRRMVSSRVVRVPARGVDAFAPIQRIGGPTGWYGADWFWRLRGLLDRLRGGVGLRRGRRHPHQLQPGDTIDFWRVERLDPGRRLLLAAEMRIPGRLWLQFDVEDGDRGAEIWQTTVFDPAGYVGRLYWYLLYPVHRGIFDAMLRGIRRASLAG
jgi:uncharacterized protein YbjT (DUF2867 family)